MITPSPMPMTTCTPIIAAATVPTDAAPFPPSAYSRVNIRAASGGASPAAIPDATVTPLFVRGSTFLTTRKMAYPPKAPTIAMLMMLRPSALTPPSAKRRHCTVSTTETHSVPTHGPTSTAARTPPSKWPLVPLATGKFSICTANTNAAVRPASGICLSSIVWEAFFRHTARPATATAPPATDVGPSMKPSGMCIATDLKVVASHLQ